MKTSLVILVSIVSLLICIFSGAINWTIQFTIVGIVYFLLGTLISMKRLNIFKSAILLSPFILIYGISWIFIHNMLTLPIIIIPVITGFYGFYLAIQHPSKAIYIRIPVVIVVFFLCGFIFMSNWFSFASNKDAYKRYKLPDIGLYYQNGTKFNNKNFIGKITILDFWNKSCGLCFKQFPEIEMFYKNLDTNNIKLFVVNIPIYDTTSDRKILDEMNYSFRKLSLRITASEVREELKIRGVPTILVVDPEGFVYYEGHFFSDRHVFVNNIRNILNRIKRNYRYFS